MASTFVPLVPKNLGHPPVQWSAAEVKAWLKFCVEEFSLSPICTTRFDMNGKALCLLTRTDFMERAPHAGDVLHNVFQKLRQQDGTQLVCHPQFHTGVLLSNSGSAHTSPTGRQTFVPILPQPRRLSSTSSHTATTATTTASSCSNGNQNRPGITISATDDALPCIPINLLSPAPSERSPSDTSDSSYLPDRGTPCHNTMEPDVDMDIKPDGASCPSPCNDDGAASGEGGCRLLWEFVYQLLQDHRYADLVCWESEPDLTFRINNQAGLADLWGQQKNKDNMTYEKLSRALRYYYKMNIIKKVTGRRLTYRFLQHPTKIKRGQRGARPHASRVAAEEQAEVTPHVTSSSPANEEEADDIKAVQVPLSESAADSTASAKPSTTSENQNSEQEPVVTYSGVASPAVPVSCGSPMSLPVLLSSSISVGSNISTAASTLPSSSLFITSTALNSIEKGTPEYVKLNVDSEASTYHERESSGEFTKDLSERASLDADTTFGSRFEQNSVTCHFMTEKQHNHIVKFFNEEENSNDSGHIPDNQNYVVSAEQGSPQFPHGDKYMLDCKAHSNIGDSETKPYQHERDDHLKQNLNHHDSQTGDKSPLFSQPQKSHNHSENCPSPLVYTELTPKQSTDVSKAFSASSPKIYPVSFIGYMSAQPAPHNDAAVIDRIKTDSEFQDTEAQQSLYQVHPMSSNHLFSYTQHFEPHQERSTLQHDDTGVLRSRPGTPYSENYQHLHENSIGPDCASGRTEFPTNRKHSPIPIMPKLSYSHTPESPMMQLHVSVSKRSVFDKRKSDEPIGTCNTHPAHQKRICLSQPSASPFPSQHFLHTHDSSHRSSLVRTTSQPDIRHNTLPRAHASYGNDHSTFLKDPIHSQPRFGIRPGIRDHSTTLSCEVDHRHSPSQAEVMDLSKPSRSEKYGEELEQEEPEDLSMKPKAVPVML